MYAAGNPLKYKDPSGHDSAEKLAQHVSLKEFDYTLHGHKLLYL
jgi:hypothetical protein